MHTPRQQRHSFSTTTETQAKELAMTLLLLLLMLVGTGLACQEQVVNVTLQRDTVSAVSCPLKSEQVTWTEIQGGQKGVQWRNHLIFTNVQGPENQLYRCQLDNVSALVNVTVIDVPSNTVDGIIDYCQHGNPCALRCPFTKDDAMDWPGMAFVKELWWGEEWSNVHIQGESPIMISPSVMIADSLRNPSLLGCKSRYYITEKGHELTGLPVGETMDGCTKKMKMEIIRPYSHIVRPIYKDLRKIIFMPVTVGQHLEIGCEGIAWNTFDMIYWLKKPCRNDTCETELLIPRQNRISEQNMNTTLVKNVLGYPLSKKLVFDPVDASDLQSIFYCKLDSTGWNDLVTVYLRDQNAPPRRVSNKRI